MNYVIIGNSAAAVGTIEGIRQIDKTGKITVISDEKYHTYSRPLISYWLMGKVTDKNIYYRSADFYEKNGVETMFDTRGCEECRSCRRKHGPLRQADGGYRLEAVRSPDERNGEDSLLPHIHELRQRKGYQS